MRNALTRTAWLLTLLLSSAAASAGDIAGLPELAAPEQLFPHVPRLVWS